VLRPESETRRWYEDKVRQYGYDYRGLGFRTRTSQEKRFDALQRLGSFEGRRLLDVGCGFGDFLAFLHERGVEPRYTGIDVCSPMVDRCEERFAHTGNRFLVADALAFEPDGPYDFVIASGVFGLEAEGARERIRPTLARMFQWCRVGLAANFLSARSPRHAAQRVYVEPAEALDAAFELTPAVRLDHTYLPNDFTIHLYKTPAWELGARRSK